MRPKIPAVRSTPGALRTDLPSQMEWFGLDPADYQDLLELGPVRNPWADVG